MPVRLDVSLVGDRYDAGSDDPRRHEWPPHPARVFAALRSVAGEDELEPLRELERLGPPLIHVSPATHGASRGYVVTNAVDREGKHQVHVVRTSGMKRRRYSFPAASRVQFDWLDGDQLSDEVVAGLDRLARRVPYLGRSTSPAILIFSRVADPEPFPGLETWEPTESAAAMSIRVPYPGYLDELNDLYALEPPQPAWQAADSRSRCSYRRAGVEEQPAPEAWVSRYPDLVILRFVGQRPPGRLVNMFTQALRSKVMQSTEDPLPPALHGHDYPGQPHVAYLGLPFTGFEHADGQLMALAVAIPGLDRPERRRILRGILGAEPDLPVKLRVPGLRATFELRHTPNDPLPYSATVERWTREAKAWVTATPIVLDRYPKDGDVEAAVAASIVKAGLPEPVGVEASRHPMTPGGVALKPKDLPKRCEGRLYTHARVVFDRAIPGPVLAGAGRYFGVGLFVPEASRGSS